MRGADDDHVAGHDGRGCQPNLAGDQVHVLVGFQFQVRNAAFAEPRIRNPRDRVQRNHPVALGHVEDAGLLAVAPVRQPATGLLAWCDFAAFALVLAVQPQEFAGRRIQRHDRAARSRRGIDDAVGHQGCGLEIELGLRAEGRRIEAPCNFKVIEIFGIDLAVGCVSSIGEVASVGQPFATRGIETLGERWRAREYTAQHRNESRQDSALEAAGPGDQVPVASVRGSPTSKVPKARR